jgi:NADPH-dependent 2,4-dienoyl-CoA reductase/sulfur reductase-like enzyme
MKGHPEGRAWLTTAEKMKVGWFGGTRVFAAPEPGVLALENSSGAFVLGYRALVLATGARERLLPFPGWTLPNVTGAGGLQALVKSGLPIAGRVVIAGSGPLLLAVAKFLHREGADVRLVAEQAPRAALIGFAAKLALHPEKFIQAVQLRSALFDVPYLTGCWAIEAHGHGKVESVTLRRGAKSWSEACDYLACGFGMVPNLELPALLGCRLAARGVVVDKYQQSSLPRVYCAGEITGIGGLERSLVEGEIAGFAAAGRPERAERRFAARAAQHRFAAAVERAFALRPEIRGAADAATIVCRCEDVRLAAVRDCSGWREAKLHTRCGMGPCQGRICGPALEFLRGWQADSVRPPVFPATIAALAETFGPGGES